MMSPHSAAHRVPHLGWAWWRHKGDRTGVRDAIARMEESQALAERLSARRERNGFGEEIASALMIGKKP